MKPRKWISRKEKKKFMSKWGHKPKMETTNIVKISSESLCIPSLPTYQHYVIIHRWFSIFSPHPHPRAQHLHQHHLCLRKDLQLVALAVIGLSTMSSGDWSQPSGLMCKSALIYTLLIFHYGAVAPELVPWSEAEALQYESCWWLMGKKVAFVSEHNCWL